MKPELTRRDRLELNARARRAGLPDLWPEAERAEWRVPEPMLRYYRAMRRTAQEQPWLLYEAMQYHVEQGGHPSEHQLAMMNLQRYRHEDMLRHPWRIPRPPGPLGRLLRRLRGG